MKPRTSSEEPEDTGLVTQVGSLEIDWPRSIGYFGGIGIAVACELIAPPIAIFIAAIPLLKLFKHPGRPWPLRVVADALEGAAKPVGADAEAVVRLVPGVPAKRRLGTKARRSGNDRRASRGRLTTTAYGRLERELPAVVVRRRQLHARDPELAFLRQHRQHGGHRSLG